VKVTPTALPGVVLIEPAVHRDARGLFFEGYNQEKYDKAGVHARFVQDNQSNSVRGTLRGLHMQTRKPQAKLIRVLRGEIFDVAVDVRLGSPTFGKWISATLSADNFLQIFVPVGFAHGFIVTSETAEVEYKCSDFYDPGGELGLRWDDPQLAIPWPTKTPLLSPKDAANPGLKEAMDRLPRYGAA